MSEAVTLDELHRLETWAKEHSADAPEFVIALRASNTLRDLMSLNLSQKNLLKYLQQEMGISPKSERGSNALSKQPGESVIPRAILRQP